MKLTDLPQHKWVGMRVLVSRYSSHFKGDKFQYEGLVLKASETQAFVEPPKKGDYIMPGKWINAEKLEVLEGDAQQG